MANGKHLPLTLPAGAGQSEISDFILHNVEAHPGDIVRLTAERFGLSRQSASKRVRKLIDAGLLAAEGRTRGRTYQLANIVDRTIHIKIAPGTEEDAEWRENVRPLMEGAPANVVDVCYYGFTEMLNNVVDHSGSGDAEYTIQRSALRTVLTVRDNGVGIFNKIQADFKLSDARHAILELSKGKLTSNPAAHTGEGIFFTSRMFDVYLILSGNLIFTSRRGSNEGEDRLVNFGEQELVKGTLIHMQIANDSQTTPWEVFEQYETADSDDHGFSKTIVPVSLAQYEGEKLISRSQAKRIVARFDQFVEVVLDFAGVTEIGPAFADEIFRVYKREHPNVHLYPLDANFNVTRAIERAEGQTEVTG